MLARLLIPLLVALTAQGVKTVDKGRRTVASDEAWAPAVARLTCRNAAGKQVLGTAMLVGPSHAITAYHVAGGCEKVALLQFGYRNGTAQQTRTSGKIVAGSAAQDWAILQLDSPVKGISPIAMAAGKLTDYDTKKLLVAGYSADVDVGRGGQVLSFDAKCRLLRWDRKKHVLHTNGVAYFGASGGPAFVKDKKTDAWHWIGINHASTAARTTAGFRTFVVHQAMYADALKKALAGG